MIAHYLLPLLTFLSSAVGAPSTGNALERRTDWQSSGSGGSSGTSGYGSNSYQQSGSNQYSGSDDSDSSDSSGGSGNSWDGGQGATTIISETTVTSAASSWETPKYGSGSWGSVSDYGSCVQMCQAQFGNGGGTSTSTAQGSSETTATATFGGSSAAATHTIIVAPSQGVLRFVPFAVTANEGDTLHYIWGAGPHTVTLSDGDNVCNRSTTSQAFDSGKLNATQTFETTVKTNGSKPVFYYCTVGQHCVSGMFGLINPPTTNVTNNLTDLATTTSSAAASKGTSGGGVQIGCKDNSMDCWIDQWKSTSGSARSIYDGVKSKCSSSPAAWAWGGKWDMSQHTTATITKEVIIKNVMYSRLMFASNPSMLIAGQSIPANYTTPPELDSFVTAASNTTGSTSGDTAGTISSASGAGTSSTVLSDAANASSTATGGAGRAFATSFVTYLVGLAGLCVAMLL